jgi:hypothetical protein
MHHYVKSRTNFQMIKHVYSLVLSRKEPHNSSCFSGDRILVTKTESWIIVRSARIFLDVFFSDHCLCVLADVLALNGYFAPVVHIGS